MEKSVKSKIVFRLDDICDTMNIDNFFRIKKLFNRYGIKPLLGVVPLNTDETLMVNSPYPDFLELIHFCKSFGWTIAMHGTHHLYDSTAKGIITKRPKSEFSGKTLEEQKNLLVKGKKKMVAEGLDTDIFFAPGHSYDKNTILALKLAGFCTISDGRAHGNYHWKGMDFVPVRYFSCEPKPGGQIVTVCFHLNNMDEQAFIHAEKYIEKYIKNIIGFDEAKNLPQYNVAMALADERMFVFYEDRIHPVLSVVKRRFYSVTGVKKYDS